MSNKCEREFGGILITPYLYILVASVLTLIMKMLSIHIIIPRLKKLFKKLLSYCKCLKLLKNCFDYCCCVKNNNIDMNEPLTQQRDTDNIEIDQSNDVVFDDEHTTTLYRKKSDCQGTVKDMYQWMNNNPGKALDLYAEPTASSKLLRIVRNDVDEMLQSTENVILYYRIKCIYIIFIFFLLCATAEEGRNSWQTYQNLCASIIYSSIPTTFISILFDGIKDADEKKEMYLKNIEERYERGIDLEIDYEEVTYYCRIMDINKEKSSAKVMLLDLSKENEIIEDIKLSVLRVPDWYIDEYIQNELDRYVVSFDTRDQLVLTGLFIMFFMPVLATHVFLGWIVYIWQIVILGFAIYFIFLFTFPFRSIIGENAVIEYMAILCLTYFIQTGFNYAVFLIYEDRFSYADATSHEYQLRLQLSCYLNNVFEDTQSIISFFFWT